MAIPIIVRHASPVSALPRRGRTERHGFEVLSTPVSIPEVDPIAFREMPPIPMGQVALYGIHAYEGGTWARAGQHDVGPGYAAADVLAYMADPTRIDPGTAEHIRETLRFTPLSAARLVASGSHSREAAMPLGDPEWHLGGHALGRVTREERERSAARLRSWISGNLAIAGDAVMVRTPVLADVMPWHKRLNVYATTQLSLSNHDVRGIRPDRARALCSAIDLPFDDGLMEEGLGLFEEWSRGLTADDDVALLANRLPSLVDVMAREDLGQPGARRRIDAAAATATLDRLRPWRLRGALGGISLDEAPEAFRICLATLDDLPKAGVQLPVTLRGPQGLIETLRDQYISRLEDLDPEDAAALSMVA